VQTGEYASQSEAIQEAIRNWTSERGAPAVTSVSQLRGLWEEATQDGSDGLDPDLVFDGLQKKYDALAVAEQR
jgi:Arc/MetJ-type ribon-helix-helix transcriptional regulator